MTTRKAKRQLASAYDRAVADMIAWGLRNRLGPDDEAPPGMVVWPIEMIIDLLDHFAKHGTFDLDASQPDRDRGRRSWMIPGRYRFLRTQGKTYEGAVAILTEEFDCSETTVRNLIPADSKKGAPVLK
jgi:hypothetical protein